MSGGICVCRHYLIILGREILVVVVSLTLAVGLHLCSALRKVLSEIHLIRLNNFNGNHLHADV
jgi:hypothetical protein